MRAPTVGRMRKPLEQYGGALLHHSRWRELGFHARDLASPSFTTVFPGYRTPTDRPASLNAMGSVLQGRVLPGAVLSHSTAAVLWGIPIPLALDRGVDMLRAGAVVGPDGVERIPAVAPGGWVEALRMLGQTPVALLIAVIATTLLLGFRRGKSGTAIERTLENALGPVCSVILITGAGGMFGGVLRATGIGDAIADSLAAVGIPLILAAYIIAAAIRIAQGSATVALATAAALVAPGVLASDLNQLQVACIVLALAAGSVLAGHVNDSGFWLVSRLLRMDVKTTLRTWTVQQTIESVTGFVLVLVIYGIVSLV